MHSMELVRKVPFANKPALVQKMAWHLTGNKPLAEPMVASFTDEYMHHSA